MMGMGTRSRQIPRSRAWVFWIGVVRRALAYHGVGPETAEEDVVEEADAAREVVESESDVTYEKYGQG